MQRIGRILRNVFFVLIAVVAALAMIDNREPIALYFLGYSSIELSVYWWLVAAFVIGFITGWLAGSIGALRAKAGARKANRALAKRDDELDRLKSPDSTP